MPSIDVMDFKAKHGEVRGQLRDDFGIVWSQGGYKYDKDGHRIDEKTGLYADPKVAKRREKEEKKRKKAAEKAAREAQEAAAAAREAAAEEAAAEETTTVVGKVDDDMEGKAKAGDEIVDALFEYDRSVIENMEDFNDFVDAMDGLPKKEAKLHMKAFADEREIDVKGNIGYDKMVEEVQAEFKGKLEEAMTEESEDDVL